MRTTFEMEKIINKDRAVQRKREILLLKDGLKYETVGSPLPFKEKLAYNILIGKRYLNDKKRTISLW